MTYELTAGVVICPTCYRVGAGWCVCSPERAYASDEAYAEAMWLAALQRAERAVHTTTAPVICEYCAEVVGRLDGYRHGYTLDGLHYRCPGVTR
jgi:hypothetical protein